jgi:hypothetical protein
LVRKLELFLVVYTVLTVLMNIALLLVGESRVDAYVSVNILVYFISYTIVKPLHEAPLIIKLLNATLLLLFTTIVIYRVYEVLF